jgi:NADP-dependent aldehyde dehydrogenase
MISRLGQVSSNGTEMDYYPVLIDGAWRRARARSIFRAVNPATGEELPGDYPLSDFADIEDAVRAGRGAALEMMTAAPESLADYLELLGERIGGATEALARMAARETGLPLDPRLRLVEIPRMIRQLRLAADAARDRSWCRATIDTQADIRSKYAPLGGPVVVFGPNNFPFACNALGGTDFAAAIAVGNPVIAKAHPYHPGTTRLLAEIAFGCLEKSGLPPAAVQLIYHMQPEDGLRCVAHPMLGAFAFTGSRPAALALKAAADKAGKPAYIETSSLNPVFLLPGALKTRAEEAADELFASCTQGAGQFCTKPGLIVFIADPAGFAFFKVLRSRFQGSQPGVLLGRSVLEGIETALAAMGNAGAEVVVGGKRVGATGFRFENTLLHITGESFLRNPAPLQQEAFGAVSLCVLCRNEDEMLGIAAVLEGNLASSIYSHEDGADEALYQRLEPVLRIKVGRLLNDRVPTGITVTASMVHGGPYPATGHPGFSSFGAPISFYRFAALHGYDRVRRHRLPPELQDRNPTGKMWRLIDGEWTRKNIERPEERQA